jgi:hypothetical protein
LSVAGWIISVIGVLVLAGVILALVIAASSDLRRVVGKWRRIKKEVRWLFDDDGYRTHRSPTGMTYYETSDGHPIYPLRPGSSDCVAMLWTGRPGNEREPGFCDRSGRRLKEEPSADTALEWIQELRLRAGHADDSEYAYAHGGVYLREWAEVEERETHVCPECGKNVISLKGLQQHRKAKHGGVVS